MLTRSVWNRVAFLCGSLALLVSNGAEASAWECENNGDGTVTCHWDCLAQGTRITLATGSTLPIEDVTSRMQVRADATGQSLAVLQRVGGRLQTRDVLMLEDEFGHKLTLTAHHPVITVDGPLPAMSLEPGDQVFTDRGIARLTQVDWSSEDVLVYNLVLNDRAPGTAEEVDTTMFANGYLVGDAVMEQKVAP